jgi:uncharacterized membrane protein
MVVVGLVLLIIGAVLTFVPVAPQPSETVYSDSYEPYYHAHISEFSLTGTIAVSVSWSANATVEILAAALSCQGSDCPTGNITQVSGLVNQTGTSGSFTLYQPSGGSFIMGIWSTSGNVPASATFNLTTAVTQIGVILVIIGILVLIAGVVLRKKRPKAPAAVPPAPSQPSSTGTSATAAPPGPPPQGPGPQG